MSHNSGSTGNGSPRKGLSGTLQGNSPCRVALLVGLSITLQECPHFRDVPFVSVPLTGVASGKIGHICRDLCLRWEANKMGTFNKTHQSCFTDFKIGSKFVRQDFLDRYHSPALLSGSEPCRRVVS